MVKLKEHIRNNNQNGGFWDFYDAWANAPVPLIFNKYFFKWTNPEDINNPNIKPKLNEIGPYS